MNDTQRVHYVKINQSIINMNFKTFFNKSCINKFLHYDLVYETY